MRQQHAARYLGATRSINLVVSFWRCSAIVLIIVFKDHWLQFWHLDDLPRQQKETMHMVNSAWMFQDLPPVEIDLHGIVCPYPKSLTLWSHMCLLDVMLMSHALQGWNQFPNEWLVLTIELSSVGKAAFQVWVVWNALVENQPRVKLPTLFGCLFGGWL